MKRCLTLVPQLQRIAVGHNQVGELADFDAADEVVAPKICPG